MRKKYLLLFLVICLFITGCKNKTKEIKTTDDFISVCINNDFNVENNIHTYKDSSYIKNAVIAKKNDDIQIEMIVYDTIENAHKIQEEQIKKFNLLKNTGSGGEKKDKGKNYYKYFLISNNYYMVSSRIDNTLIFAKIPFKDKDQLDTILNDLDY